MEIQTLKGILSVIAAIITHIVCIYINCPYINVNTL